MKNRRIVSAYKRYAIYSIVVKLMLLRSFYTCRCMP